MLSTIAMYLPQFHRVSQNDKWWGEGYTDWVATKGGEPLFEGHSQPRVPLNDNYYNLLEYDVMAWQAELMKKYCVDGMCFYHYWFDKEQRILEKPAENLLQWADIQMPFFFCWANVTWSRTWKKIINSDAWAGAYEKAGCTDGNGILLKQTYGREGEWETHFQYLLPFFKDDRYIKLDGKPVFMILRPSYIIPLWNMIRYLDKRAQDCGLPGIYVIGMEDKMYPGLDATCIRQPDSAGRNYGTDDCAKEGVPVQRSYDRMWEIILEQQLQNCKSYSCALVDFDNTPRMGKKGVVMEGTSPDKFYTYFKQLYGKSMQLGQEFIFINAWNEWGEGMYLEPDNCNGYRYLEAIRKVVTECRKEENILPDQLQRAGIEDSTVIVEPVLNVHQKQSDLLDKWLLLRDNNVNMSTYFKKYNYHNIAIYGMGKLGNHMLHELENTDISIVYGIDRNAESVCSTINVYSPEAEKPRVDAIIIMIWNQYAQISELLSENMNCAMVSIEEIIVELAESVLE